MGRCRRLTPTEGSRSKPVTHDPSVADYRDTSPSEWGGKLTLSQHRQGPGHQGHETHRHQGVALQAALALDDALDDLRRRVAADRYDQDAAQAELVDQRLRALLGGGGDDDAVERRLARPALAAVADVKHD